MRHDNGLGQEADGTPIRGAHHLGGELLETTLKDAAQ